MLSQFVLSGGSLFARDTARGAQGARGAGGSRGQSRPCRHAAAGREAGTGGRYGGAVWDPADTTRGGPCGCPRAGDPMLPLPMQRTPQRPGWERSCQVLCPRGHPVRPARPHPRSRACTRVPWGPHNTPQPHGARGRGGLPRISGHPWAGTVAGDRLREQGGGTNRPAKPPRGPGGAGGPGRTGSMQGSAPRPALRRGT